MNASTEANLQPLPTPDAWTLKHLLRCDPGVRVRRLVEVAIVKMVVQTAIEQGKTVSVFDGEGTPVKRSTDEEAILVAAFEVDKCNLVIHGSGPRGKAIGEMFLVFGNSGWDVISDYHTSLEPFLKQILAYSDAMREWF